jgi:predicted MFS family arabinose efflux permease
MTRTDQGAASIDPADQLSEGRVILLAIAAAIVTANAYYIHPIIALVGESFDVRTAWVGLVPAANQVALAVGILFLLPLGDRLSNRRLITLALMAQLLALSTMALAESFWVFVAASTALGFFTITPYVLPAYASKRVPGSRLGHVTAVLTAGVITGVVLSRTASGVVGEYLGWRTIYWIAAALMVAATFALRRMLDDDAAAQGPASRDSYWRLIASLWPLSRNHPEVILSGVIQGFNFGIFLLIWMGIGLHLTSDAIGLGVDDVGYLGVFSIMNVLTTPRLGRWADEVGPERARVIMALIQMFGVSLLFVAGDSFWYLTIPIIVMSIAGPMIDVTGRMTCLAGDPAIRTRLLSLFIILMFLGGGVGSWTGTIAYDLGGWTLNVSIAMGFSAVIVLLSLIGTRFPAGSR